MENTLKEKMKDTLEALTNEVYQLQNLMNKLFNIKD
jgi:hypothetical protein